MFIIYEDNVSVRTGRPPDVYKMDATKLWLDHFSNSLILTAIQRSPKDFSEKIQATKELAICEKKMTFWARLPLYDLAKATQEATKLRHLWSK